MARRAVVQEQLTPGRLLHALVLGVNQRGGKQGNRQC